MAVCTTTCTGTARYYINAIGVEIIIETCLDISEATKVAIKVEKPDGTEEEWAGEILGTTQIKYITVDGDLDQAGKYYIQAYVETVTSTGYGTTTSFNVTGLFG
jgi:hypothetical protein